MIRVFYYTGTSTRTSVPSTKILVLNVQKEGNKTRSFSLSEIQRFVGRAFTVTEFREDDAYSALIGKLYNTLIASNQCHCEITELISKVLNGAVALSQADNEIPRCIDKEFVPA